VRAGLYPERCDGDNLFVVLLDEPTAHIDLGNKVKVLRVIRELSASGRTVLFSTHDPNEASMVADAVVILFEERILGLGTPNGVITKDIIQYIQQM
jgi:iron complex transport system ATP-binding protein